MTPANQAKVREAAEKIRAIMLSVDGHDEVDYTDLREAVLAEAELCWHCGSDERGRPMGCQCWNDE